MGEESGRPDQVQGLLGQTRYLWERIIALQLQVRTLTDEREDLEITLGLHNQMAEL